MDGKLTTEEFAQAKATFLTSPTSEGTRSPMSSLTAGPQIMRMERQQIDLAHKKADTEHKKVDMEQKKAATEQLLALGRLHKEGQLTTAEFAHAKANVLVASPMSEGDGSPAAALPRALSGLGLISNGTDRVAINLDYNTEPTTLGRDRPTATRSTHWSMLLRRELNGQTRQTLLRRAAWVGANADQIEHAEDNKTALIDLIVQEDAALRWELGHLTLKELRHRAARLGVSKREVEEAEESDRGKDALVELVALVDQRRMRAEDSAVPHEPSRELKPVTVLDQILVGLKADPQDLQHATSPELITEPEQQSQHLQIERSVMGGQTQSPRLNNWSQIERNLLGDIDAEQIPLLVRTRMLEDAKASVTRVADAELRGDRQRQWMAGSKLKELQEMLHALGAETREIEAAVEEADNPRAALVDLVVLYEAKVGRPTVAAPQEAPSLPLRNLRSTAGPQSEAEPDSLDELCPAPEPANVGAVVLDIYQPSSLSPATHAEHQVVTKMQAIWRGKAGLKKAVEEEQASVAGSDRVVAAKRTIRKLQVAVMLLVMLTTAVGTLLPNYVLGAMFGAVANGDGFDGALTLNIGIRCGVFEGAAIYLQMELFALAMRDTPFVPGTLERIARPLLCGGFGHCFWASNLWLFMDLQNPENDISLVKGVPGAILYLVATTLLMDGKCQPIELWQLQTRAITKYLV
jgi:hypothetical protein